MTYKNILLIDDDEDDQEIFLTAMQKVSSLAACTAITSASDALHRLTSKQIRPDIIFLDLNMPVMNGHQFLNEIKKVDELKEIPVVIISTTSNVATIQLTRQSGAHGFVTKPNKFDELIDTLRTYIH